jgi:hypothetical protein
MYNATPPEEVERWTRADCLRMALEFVAKVRPEGSALELGSIAIELAQSFETHLKHDNR